LCTANGFMGSTFVGVARAALEHAVQYAKERIQAGCRSFAPGRQASTLRDVPQGGSGAVAQPARCRLQYGEQSVRGAPQARFPQCSMRLRRRSRRRRPRSRWRATRCRSSAQRPEPRVSDRKAAADARSSLIEDGANDVLALTAATSSESRFAKGNTMELREVLGRRRSIRFVRPYKPVEKEKIQMMLEARALRRTGQRAELRALVVFATPRRRRRWSDPAPVAGWQIRLARSSSFGTSRRRRLMSRRAFAHTRRRRCARLAERTSVTTHSRTSCCRFRGIREH